MLTDELIGFGCILLSGICYGSMFVPLNKFETHDGMFVQWVQSGSAFCVGLAIFIWKGFPKVYPLAIVGGVFFATGNVTAIPIVNTIGMGLGMLLWGSVQVVAGWAVPRFGLFGLKAEEPASNLLQIIGMVLTLGSGFMFVLVRYADSDKRETNAKISDVENPMKIKEAAKIAVVATEASTADDSTNSHSGLVTWITSNSKKIIAVIMSIFAGFCYGQMLTPMTYIFDNYPDEPKDGLVYVFSMVVGIWTGSCFYFLLYCIYKRNAPIINPETVLPSVLYGVLWAVATAAWFVSTQKLTQAISIPISTRLPGVIGSLWDVFFYKTIKGRRNLLILAAAIGVALVGVTLVGLSQEVPL